MSGSSIEVSTSRCGRDNPGSNPGCRTFFFALLSRVPISRADHNIVHDPFYSNCTPPTMTSVIQVNRKQSGNDLLKKFTRCAYTFADIEPDYVVGRTACALYLSIRYHALHPNYIYERINRIGENYELRILLVVVDHVEHKSYLKELSKLSIRSNMTLMLCWTVEDAAMYLEKYKLSEDKPADVIMEKPTNYEYEDALDQYMIDALSENRYINRTDATSIVSLFDTFKRISTASPEELSLCPGVGLQKAQRLYELLHKSMKRGIEPRCPVASSSQAARDAVEEAIVDSMIESNRDETIHGSNMTDDVEASDETSEEKTVTECDTEINSE